MPDLPISPPALEPGDIPDQPLSRRDPMPKKLLKDGHRDMLRMSDARMSGTSYGACVLPVSPESHVGGPLALLQTGDIVTLDVNARTINMEVSDEELARRRTALVPPAPRYERGYGYMYSKHIQEANEGRCRAGDLLMNPQTRDKLEGGSMVGPAYPPTDESNLDRFAEWRKQHGR